MAPAGATGAPATASRKGPNPAATPQTRPEGVNRAAAPVTTDRPRGGGQQLRPLTRGRARPDAARCSRRPGRGSDPAGGETWCASATRGRRAPGHPNFHQAGGDRPCRGRRSPWRSGVSQVDIRGASGPSRRPADIAGLADSRESSTPLRGWADIAVRASGTVSRSPVTSRSAGGTADASIHPLEASAVLTTLSG